MVWLSTLQMLNCWTWWMPLTLWRLMITTMDGVHKRHCHLYNAYRLDIAAITRKNDNITSKETHYYMGGWEGRVWVWVCFKQSCLDTIGWRKRNCDWTKMNGFDFEPAILRHLIGCDSNWNIILLSDSEPIDVSN